MFEGKMSKQQLANRYHACPVSDDLLHMIKYTI